MVLFAWQSKQLENNSEAETPLNIMGMNRSPYGGLMAIALQGQISTNFHIGFTASDDHSGCSGCSGCASSGHHHHPSPDASAQRIGDGHMQGFIADMKQGRLAVTNPVPPSPGLRRYARKEVEEKLRFAYELDPSHYANYNTLHFFYAEQLNGSSAAAPDLDRLAWRTYDYCMEQEGDPRPALTAASACLNLINLKITQVRGGDIVYDETIFHPLVLKMDESFDKYHRLTCAWNESGSWRRLSAARTDELEQYALSLVNQRDLTIQIIERLHQEHRNKS